MKKKKKASNQTPENKLQFELNSCYKAKDLCGAISHYDAAVSLNLRPNQHHFNALLYLSSTSVTEPSLKDTALDHGFRIFDHMCALGINHKEASITGMARIAAVKGDGDYAFELVKTTSEFGVSPRLCTYGPALFCFCENLDAENAYEVEEHINSVGVSLEEPENAALLKASAESGRAERVYGYLHKLRCSVRCVGELTATIIE